MPKLAKYNDNTPFNVFVGSYPQDSEVCTAAQAWNAKYSGKTIEEMEASGCLQDKDYDPSWGIWLLHKLGTKIDVVIRKRLIAVIKDSMQAFSIYLTFDWLTDEEDKLLEEKFKGKLPTAENELATGIVTRAKNG